MKTEIKDFKGKHPEKSEPIKLKNTGYKKMSFEDWWKPYNQITGIDDPECVLVDFPATAEQIAKDAWKAAENSNAIENLKYCPSCRSDKIEVFLSDARQTSPIDDRCHIVCACGFSCYLILLEPPSEEWLMSARREILFKTLFKNAQPPKPS
jgi:hypothetical protein